MNGINERILELYNYKRLNKYSEFAELTGLSHQTVSNYLKGKQKPDVDKLAIILQSFDDVNAEWLLTGKGEMLKSNNDYPEDLVSFIKNTDTSKEMLAYTNRLEENNQMLEKLRENDKIEIEWLRNKIKQLEASIEQLNIKLKNYEREFIKK